MSIIMARLLACVHLSDSQYGFVRKRGTMEALFNVAMLIIDSMQNNTPLHAVFFDISKAFDMVNRGFLFAALYDTGVQGKM